MSYDGLGTSYLAQRFAPNGRPPVEEFGEPESLLPTAIRMLDAPPSAPVAWTVRLLQPAEELGMLVGDGGVGKTTALLAISAAKAGGYPAFDNADYATEPEPVLIVSEEDSADVLMNRTEALARGHGWDLTTVLANIHLLALQGVRLHEPQWQRHLVDETLRIGAGLVIFDPLFELGGLEENSNTDQRPLIQYCRQLIRETGASLLFGHHAGKVGEGKRKLDRVRGASAWSAAARAVFFAELHDDGVRLECLKMSRSARLAPFVLERTVEEDPENPGTWLRATLRYKTAKAADQDAAERWITGQLEAGARLTTTELKGAAQGTGISGAQVSAAIKKLEARQVIRFEAGSRGAKHWFLVTLPGDAGQGRQGGEMTLPRLPEGCRARSENPQEGCQPPMGGNLDSSPQTLFGQGRQGRAAETPDELGDAWEPEGEAA